MWTKYNYQGIAFEVDARGAVRWASDWGKLQGEGIAAVALRLIAEEDADIRPALWRRYNELVERRHNFAKGE